MRKINYKGYTVSQAANNHVMISDNSGMVFHAPCNKKLTKEELKAQVDSYLYFLSEMERVEDE